MPMPIHLTQLAAESVDRDQVSLLTFLTPTIAIWVQL